MSGDICAVCGAPFTPDATSRIRICPACRDFYGLVSPDEKAKRRRQEHEGAEQEYLFRWAEYAKCTMPELALLFHVPNGGKRSKTEAARMKMQGVKAGVPDLFLPVARGGYHGLFIELKAGRNKATEKQGEWLAALREQGYAAVICTGWEAAKATLENYLSQKR